MAEPHDTSDEIKATHKQLKRGAGGTSGGTGMFAIGFILAALGTFLFLNSVDVVAGPQGWASRMVNRMHGHSGGFWDTTSTGVVFLPFFLGIVILFYDKTQKLGWGLFYGGIIILVVEILSRMQFHMRMSVTSLLILIATVGAGAGLMLRSFRDSEAADQASDA